MGRKEKLIAKLMTIPKDFTFEEARTLLELLGFEMSNKGKISGSRIKFFNGRTFIILHKPHPRKELLEYQIMNIIDKLKEDDLI